MIASLLVTPAQAGGSLMEKDPGFRWGDGYSL
jgi:hypothetical protein